MASCFAEHVKLEKIETAIQIPRQACDYLYNGLSQVGSVVDRKMDTVKVQQGMGDIAVQIQKMQISLEEGSRRNEVVSPRIDEMSEKIKTAQARLDSVGSRLEQEAWQHQSWSRDAQETVGQLRQDLESVTRCLAEVQMDVQLRGQKISDLEEIIFNKGVAMERGPRIPYGPETTSLSAGYL